MANADAIRKLKVADAGNCKPDGGVPLVESVRQISDLEGASLPFLKFLYIC